MNIVLTILHNKIVHPRVRTRWAEPIDKLRYITGVARMQIKMRRWSPMGCPILFILPLRPKRHYTSCFIGGWFHSITQNAQQLIATNSQPVEVRWGWVLAYQLQERGYQPRKSINQYKFST